jgi:hypothetical protein
MGSVQSRFAIAHLGKKNGRYRSQEATIDFSPQCGRRRITSVADEVVGVMLRNTGKVGKVG